MENLDLLNIVLFMVTGFVAAFIDSTVGGGGLISVPALLASGLPVNLVLGTNKLASSMGAVTSVVSFWRSGNINKKLVVSLVPMSIIGSICGAYTVHLLPQDFMRNLVVVMLVLIAAYTYYHKEWGSFQSRTDFSIWALAGAFLMALVMGFYDGFFGPGTGTFLIFGFLFLGCDFVTAAGNGKALNTASNLAGLATFIFNGSVVWAYGIIMGLSMIAGAYFGTKMAIRHGAAYVRPLFLTVTTLLIGKQIYDIFFK